MVFYRSKVVFFLSLRKEMPPFQLCYFLLVIITARKKITSAYVIAGQYGWGNNMDFAGAGNSGLRSSRTVTGRKASVTDNWSSRYVKY